MAQSKPFVKLTGGDGNTFSIISKCGKALRQSGNPDLEKEFTDKCFAAHSYDEVLRLAIEYCDVA